MSSRTRIRFALMTLAMAAASLLGVDPALANSISQLCSGDCDKKVYPGAICQQAGRSQGLDYYYGRARNRTSSYQTADCPLVRDKSKAAIVEVRTIDRHWSENVNCSFFELLNDRVGPAFYYQKGFRENKSYRIGTTGQSDVVQTLKMLPNAPNGLDTSYLVGCSLPPIDRGDDSQIISIEVGEY